MRTGGTSPLTGSTVNCAMPNIVRTQTTSAGAAAASGVCDPAGAQSIVAFPAQGDNTAKITAWIPQVMLVDYVRVW